LRTQAASLSPLHATAFPLSISYLIKKKQKLFAGVLSSYFAGVASGGSQTTTMIALTVGNAGFV
jgi:hypothetical protein